MIQAKQAPLSNNSRQVQETKGYHLFKKIDGNRNLNELHVGRLLKSFKNRYLETVITVNEKMQIIDGQHRFECCKMLNLPVYYYVCKGYGLEEVQILNANSKDWNAEDFMNGWCNLGKPNYILYKEFKNKYGFDHNVSQALLSGSTTGGNIQEKFKNGLFEIPNLIHSESIANKIELLQPYYQGYKRHRFVLAVLQVMKKSVFSFDEFLQKLRLQRTALVDCTGAEQYAALIEKIYNYRRKPKINLRY